jgi:hypothetical protein
LKLVGLPLSKGFGTVRLTDRPSSIFKTLSTVFLFTICSAGQTHVNLFTPFDVPVGTFGW